MATAPLDTVEMVLHAARVRVNDAIQSIGGELLTDTAAFTQQFVNNAWRRAQEMLVDMGFAWLQNLTILPAVAASTQTDTGTLVWFDYTGYFDGTTKQAAPVFPQDMISPLELRERVSAGTGSAGTGLGSYMPMDRLIDGLPTVPKKALNKVWNWRQGKIYMAGATATTDIWMMYAAYLSDFVDTTGPTVPWFSQPVPIPRFLNPLAWFICAEFVKGRGDLDAGYFEGQAVAAVIQQFNLDAAQARTIFKQAEYQKMGDKYSPQGQVDPRKPKG